MKLHILCLLALIGATGDAAFVPTAATNAALPHRTAPPRSEVGSGMRQVPARQSIDAPWLRRQRQSVAGVQLRGLFGLGAPEIAIILVAAAFLLGPQKLAELGKDAGRMASELKEVPKEFQKGLEEGETNARAAKAKSMAPAEEPTGLPGAEDKT